MTSNLWVIRHGETQWNRDRRLQGHLDIPLNETGKDQAAALADRMAETFDGDPPPIFTSDLKRAIQTARAVGRRLVVVPQSTKALRERGLGLVEGKTWDELARTHPAEVKAYRTRRDRDAIPGIEPLAEFEARVLKAIRGIARRHERAIVVTHGGVLRVLLSAAEPGAMLMIANTAAYQFACTPDGELTRVVEGDSQPELETADAPDVM